MEPVVSSFPLTHKIKDGTLHISCSSKGRRREELFIELVERAVYIRNKDNKTLLLCFVVSNKYDCATLKLFYREDRLLFTVQPSQRQDYRVLEFED
nr:hypothetical protein Cplu_58 [Cedratvirus plubellavi]